MTIKCVVWTAVVVPLVTACTSIGPGRLVPTHEGYNDAVQLTMTREVLKNIVRERYHDPVQFLRVSAINAQFSVSAGANVGATTGGAGSAQAGTNVGYSDSPTITFLPLTGESIVTGLSAPLSLPGVLAYVYNWSRVRPHDVGFVIGAINNAPDRAGPTGDPYRARLNAFARLFNKWGATLILKRFMEAGSYASISKDKVSGGDLADALEWGAAFYETGDGDLKLGVGRLRIHLVVPLPHEGEVVDDLRLLGLTPGKADYGIRQPGSVRPIPMEKQKDYLWLTPRSAGRMLELSSLTVDVPAKHRESGVAPAEDGLVNSGLKLPMRIRHSAERPDSLYRIQHRGYWFYVDDTDMESKQVFLVMVSFYLSKLGSSEAPRGGPQVVLPLGG
jgi:hypothetical protein